MSPEELAAALEKLRIGKQRILDANRLSASRHQDPLVSQTILTVDKGKDDNKGPCDLAKPNPADHTAKVSSASPSQDSKKAPAPKQYVVALSAFDGKTTNQLSFAKGDIIQVVSTSGKWHKGILVKSSKFSITKKTKSYPSNFCKSFNPKQASLATTQKTNSWVKPAANATNQSISSQDIDAIKVKPARKQAVGAVTTTFDCKRVKTKGPYIARKPNQMSFGKGDVIEVVNDAGKWHLGILRTSTTCEITGKEQFFPSNYVFPI